MYLYYLEYIITYLKNKNKKEIYSSTKFRYAFAPELLTKNSGDFQSDRITFSFENKFTETNFSLL